MKEAIFRPVFALKEDGTLTVDFMDSYDSTYDTETGQIVEALNEDGYSLLAEQFDKIIGIRTTGVERMQRLSNYLVFQKKLHIEKTREGLQQIAREADELRSSIS